MDADFQSIHTQVELFKQHIQCNQRVTFSFSAGNMRIALNASTDTNEKSATIKHNGTKWVIDNIPIVNIQEIRSKYLPFIFKEFQQGIMSLMEWISIEARGLHWSYAWYENKTLMHKGYEYKIAGNIMLADTTRRDVFKISINRTDDMCTKNIEGLMVFKDMPAVAFTSLDDIEQSFHRLIEDWEYETSEQPSTDFGSHAIWTAIDKLATMMTYKLPPHGT